MIYHLTVGRGRSRDKLLFFGTVPSSFTHWPFVEKPFLKSPFGMASSKAAR